MPIKGAIKLQPDSVVRQDLAVVPAAAPILRVVAVLPTPRAASADRTVSLSGTFVFRIGRFVAKSLFGLNPGG